MTEESEKERPGVHKRCVGHNLSTTKRFQTVMAGLSYIPVFSSGVVETAVGLRIVEERVETGLKTTQSSLWETNNETPTILCTHTIIAIERVMYRTNQWAGCPPRAVRLHSFAEERQRGRDERGVLPEVWVRGRGGRKKSVNRTCNTNILLYKGKQS